MSIDNAEAVRPVRIAVCGPGRAHAAELVAAEAVGAAIARAGAVLLCGGLGGVMEAAARGAAQQGGLTMGILPGANADAANAWIALPLPTGMGEGRNVLVVRFADAVIAVGGEWGTLSEIALARKIDVPIVLLLPTIARDLGIEEAPDPETAVTRALSLARSRHN
jgi:uncharacterized protein (TIGR00725 family)